MYREGDWICTICNNLNFAFRISCNRCNRQTKRDNLQQQQQSLQGKTQEKLQTATISMINTISLGESRIQKQDSTSTNCSDEVNSYKLSDTLEFFCESTFETDILSISPLLRNLKNNRSYDDLVQREEQNFFKEQQIGVQQRALFNTERKNEVLMHSVEKIRDEGCIEDALKQCFCQEESGVKEQTVIGFEELQKSIDKINDLLA